MDGMTIGPNYLKKEFDVLIVGTPMVGRKSSEDKTNRKTICYEQPNKQKANTYTKAVLVVVWSQVMKMQTLCNGTLYSAIQYLRKRIKVMEIKNGKEK
jgi:hypothetical protein